MDDAKTTRLGFIRSLIAARFDFDHVNARGVERERNDGPTLTLDAFWSVYRRTTSAPAPLATRLVEIIVHGEDIRRPLGIRHAYPVPDAAAALAYHLSPASKWEAGRSGRRG